jgi:tRNA A37 methylthiotransferase MiaB
LRKYGLRPYVYFIHGLPGQNERTTKETVTLMEKLRKTGLEKITVYRFQPLPMSAFTRLPRAPPASHDKLSQMIVEKAKEINRRLKKGLVGKSIKAIIAGKYHKDPSFLVAYPFRHGPVTLTKGKDSYIGCSATIRITKVISDRLVMGHISSISPTYGKSKVLKYPFN